MKIESIDNDVKRQHLNNDVQPQQNNSTNQNQLSAKNMESNADTEGSEGNVTKQIEEVSTKVPSGVFLTAAFAAMGASAILQITGNKQLSHFIGQWVPAILIMGLYNKVTKLHGSERGETA